MMPGRTILNESDPVLKPFGNPKMIRRRDILRETVETLSKPGALDHYHQQASKNLKRWKKQNRNKTIGKKIQIIPGDWGEVAHILTKVHGVCFGILNMSNAYVPGGGYIEGMSAQEENMFRRTDCHFHIGSDEYDHIKDCYKPEMTELLSAKYGRVYLDSFHPRIYLRGGESGHRKDLGYEWLSEDEVFPFYELRASAQDLREGTPFDIGEARRRITAQLDTLSDASVRYAVLGAIGCGAFLNPPEVIARLYKEEILKRIDDFDLIAFAVFSAGYGSDNYAIFSKVFDES